MPSRTRFRYLKHRDHKGPLLFLPRFIAITKPTLSDLSCLDDACNVIGKAVQHMPQASRSLMALPEPRDSEYLPVCMWCSEHLRHTSILLSLISTGPLIILFVICSFGPCLKRLLPNKLKVSRPMWLLLSTAGTRQRIHLVPS